jgi:hypothetical protein
LQVTPATLGLEAIVVTNVFFTTDFNSVEMAGDELETTADNLTRVYADGIGLSGLSNDLVRVSVDGRLEELVTQNTDIALRLTLYDNTAPSASDATAGAIASLYLNHIGTVADLAFGSTGDGTDGGDAFTTNQPTISMDTFYNMRIDLTYAVGGTTGTAEFFLDDVSFGTLPLTGLNGTFGRAELVFGWFNTFGAGTRADLSDYVGYYDTYSVEQFDLTPSGVPEPSSLALAGIGLMSMAGAAWRRRKAAAAKTEVAVQA